MKTIGERTEYIGNGRSYTDGDSCCSCAKMTHLISSDNSVICRDHLVKIDIVRVSVEESGRGHILRDDEEAVLSDEQ